MLSEDSTNGEQGAHSQNEELEMLHQEQTIDDNYFHREIVRQN